MRCYVDKDKFTRLEVVREALLISLVNGLCRDLLEELSSGSPGGVHAVDELLGGFNMAVDGRSEVVDVGIDAGVVPVVQVER